MCWVGRSWKYLQNQLLFLITNWLQKGFLATVSTPPALKATGCEAKQQTRCDLISGNYPISISFGVIMGIRLFWAMSLRCNSSDSKSQHCNVLLMMAHLLCIYERRQVRPTSMGSQTMCWSPPSRTKQQQTWITLVLSMWVINPLCMLWHEHKQ